MKANLVLWNLKRQKRIPLDSFDRTLFEDNRDLVLPVLAPVSLLIGITIVAIDHWIAKVIGIGILLAMLFIVYTLACVTDILDRYPE